MYFVGLESVGLFERSASFLLSIARKYVMFKVGNLCVIIWDVPRLANSVLCFVKYLSY